MTLNQEVLQDINKSFKDVHLDVRIYLISPASLLDSTTLITLMSTFSKSSSRPWSRFNLRQRKLMVQESRWNFDFTHPRGNSNWSSQSSFFEARLFKMKHFVKCFANIYVNFWYLNYFLWFFGWSKRSK